VAMKTIPNPRRIQELDVFRGVAALVVVLYHYTAGVNNIYMTEVVPTTPKPLRWLFDGVQAVNFFFMISGFVIFMTLERLRAGARLRGLAVGPALSGVFRRGDSERVYEKSSCRVRQVREDAPRRPKKVRLRGLDAPYVCQRTLLVHPLSF